MKREVRLDRFDRTIGLDRGRSTLVEAAWWLCKSTIFLSSLPYPNVLKRTLLKLFGATVGRGLNIQPRVSIHFPWKLVIGDHCWIGQRCEIHNMEPIVLENHVALGHDVFLTSGNHDHKDSTLPYRNRPIRIRRGCWIGSRAFIGPGVTVGEHCVVNAGSVVVRDVPDWSIAAGNPATVVRARVLER